MYLKTYLSCDLEKFWEAVLVCCELFRGISKLVTEKFDYGYNVKEEEFIRVYLNNIKKQNYSKE